MSQCGTEHGQAFCGPPNGQRCSAEKHALLRCGLPPKLDKATGEIKAVETFGDAFFRLLRFTTHDGIFEPQNLMCACCGYSITGEMK